MNLNINSSNQLSYIVNVAEQFGDVPTPDNDANVTVTIKDIYGALLPGETWPVDLEKVIGTDGLYSKTFTPIANLIDGEKYRITFNITTANLLLDECTVIVIATKKERLA